MVGHPERPHAALRRGDRQRRRLPLTRAATPTATPSTAQGRLVSCEHGNRRVTRTEHDGTITVLADEYEGKRLNSPNDVVVRSDGTVFFTDPAYGIECRLRGPQGRAASTARCFVFRVDPIDGRDRVVADDMDRPNGLAFSLDERRSTSPTPARATCACFDVADDGTLTTAASSPRAPTAASTASAWTRTAASGRAPATACTVYDPDGTLIGKVLVPEIVANVAWGWPKRNRLYICATTSLYAVLLPVRGAKTM